MSNLLQMQNAHKSFSLKTIFNDETFAINRGEHIGVIGPNGAGKTTLFKTIIGNMSLDSGKIIKSSQLRMGYLPQHDLWGETETVEDFLSNRGSLPKWELRKLAKGLGFLETDFARPIMSFSGGYRMRVKLLAMLATEPNLMLLDEPTNYLDLETLMVLEVFLKNYKGAILLISHDRDFLKKTVNGILEVEQGEINKFMGSLDDYFEYKSQKQILLEKKAEQIKSERKEIIDFANKFGAKATKAKQVQSRLKKLEKLKEIVLRGANAEAKISIPSPIHTGKTILTLNGVGFGYDNVAVIDDINLQIQRGDHIGVVGVNGAGKTTLLRGFSKGLSPLSGELTWGYNVDIGYYAQHVIEDLNLNQNVREAIEEVAHVDTTTQEVKSLAGAFLFSGEDIEKPLSILSGGELARVALAKILMKRAPCLVLDEPTNHLDFETIEALIKALRTYKGTVIIVSHNRSFIRKASKKVIEVRSGKVSFYQGTYDEYLWSLENGSLKAYIEELSPEVGPSKGSEKKPEILNQKNYKVQKDIRKKIRALSREVTTFESKIERLQDEIKTYTQRMEGAEPSELKEVSIKMSTLHKELEQLEQGWELKSQKIEELEKQL